ncbi:MAG: hypothetical protein ACYDAG_14660 [Chloroflexota bacterium]
MATYRLVNVHAASLVGSYDTEDDALADVARNVRRNGGKPQSAKHIALQVHVPGEPDAPLDSGESLAHRALEHFPEPRRRSA